MHIFHQAKIIGVISDTHNLLRPEAVEALQNSELIIHAGDIGEQSIIDELERIAPVVSVRGNVDQAQWCKALPNCLTITAGEIEILVIHNLKELNLKGLSEEVKVVISGHSHQLLIKKTNDVLFLNPGSAGRRRFKLPISVAKLEIDGTSVQAEIIELAV